MEDNHEHRTRLALIAARMVQDERWHPEGMDKNEVTCLRILGEQFDEMVRRHGPKPRFSITSREDAGK